MGSRVVALFGDILTAIGRLKDIVNNLKRVIRGPSGVRAELRTDLTWDMDSGSVSLMVLHYIFLSDCFWRDWDSEKSLRVCHSHYIIIRPFGS